MIQTLNTVPNRDKFPKCVNWKNYVTNSNNNIKLKNLNAEELIAIEQASELIKQCILHKGTFLEDVLNKIAKSSVIGTVTSVGVIEFNWNNETKIRKIKFKKSKYVIGLLEKNLGEYGGHYGCFIYNTTSKTAEVFDSMQIKNKSNHTNSYVTAVSKIFSIPEKSVSPFNCMCTWRQSCQPTGGFITAKSSQISIQDPDSQHHFCYMESLLHLAEKVLDVKNYLPTYNRPTVINKGNPQLRIFVIKRWIFALIHMVGGIKNTYLRDYIYNTFTKVWYSNEIIFSAKNSVWIKKKDIRKPQFLSVEVPGIHFGKAFSSKSSIIDAVKFSHLLP